MTEESLIEMTNKYNIMKENNCTLLRELRDKEKTLEDIKQELKFYRKCVPTMARELKDMAMVDKTY